MVATSKAEPDNNAGKKYCVADLKRAETEFLAQCVLSTDADGLVDLTAVSGAIGNTNVASTRNRFALMKKRYNIKLAYKIGSGKPETTSQPPEDANSATEEAPSEVVGTKRGRKKTTAAKTAAASVVEDEPSDEETNANKWHPVNKPVAKKRRTMKIAQQDEDEDMIRAAFAHQNHFLLTSVLFETEEEKDVGHYLKHQPYPPQALGLPDFSRALDELLPWSTRRRINIWKRWRRQNYEMPPLTTDDQFTFLISCIRNANNGKIDFTEVAKECDIVSKGAAAKRYERLLKSHGISTSGSTLDAESSVANDSPGPSAGPKTPAKPRESSSSATSAATSATPGASTGDKSHPKLTPKPPSALLKGKKKTTADWKPHTDPGKVAGHFVAAKKRKAVIAEAMATTPAATTTKAATNAAGAAGSPPLNKSKGKGKMREGAVPSTEKNAGGSATATAAASSTTKKTTKKATSTTTTKTKSTAGPSSSSSSSSSSSAPVIIKDDSNDNISDITITSATGAKAKHVEYAHQYDEDEDPSDASTLHLNENFLECDPEHVHKVEPETECELPELESSFTQLADELAAVRKSPGKGGKDGAKVKSHPTSTSGDEGNSRHSVKGENDDDDDDDDDADVGKGDGEDDMEDSDYQF